MPFKIRDLIQQKGDDDNTKFVVMAMNESTYTLLFESDNKKLFDENKDILFNIPKDERTSYYVIKISSNDIDSFFKKIGEQVDNIEVRNNINNNNRLFGGKRRKSTKITCKKSIYKEF